MPAAYDRFGNLLPEHKYSQSFIERERLYAEEHAAAERAQAEEKARSEAEWNAKRKAQRDAEEAARQAERDARAEAQIAEYKQVARTNFPGTNAQFDAAWPALLQAWQVDQTRTAMDATKTALRASGRYDGF